MASAPFQQSGGGERFASAFPVLDFSLRAWRLVFGLGLFLLLAAGAARAQVPVVTAVTSARQVINKGQSLTLSVTATGATSYQWKRGNRIIPGATTSTYTLANAAVADAGPYQVVASNASGSVSRVIFVAVVVPQPQLVVFGNNYQGQMNVPTGLSNVVAMASGWGHSLALKSDGTVVAWGYNNFGQSSVPAGLSDVVAIEAGELFSMALKADGTVVTWGEVPSTPPGVTGVIALTATDEHAYALRQDGTVLEWGQGGNLQAVGGFTNVAAISGGHNGVIGLKTDGALLGWYFRSPIAINGPTDLVAVNAMGFIGLRSNGTVVALSSSLPVAEVPGLTGVSNVTAITVAHLAPFALRSDGTVVTWGGVVFSGNPTPMFPPGLANVVALAARQHHVMVLRDASGDVAPMILGQPTNVTATGTTATFSILAVGTPAPTYRWQRKAAGASDFVSMANAGAYAGVTSPSLMITQVGADMQGDQFRCVVTSAATTLTSNIVTLSLASRRLGSFVTRQPIPAEGVAALFSIEGSGPRTLLIRGVSSTLGAQGVANPLADPQLVVVNAAGTTVTSNDNWGGDSALVTAAAQAGAAALSAGSSDAAVLATLAAGTYTVRLSGAAGGAGTAIFELYDVSQNDGARLTHVAYRGPLDPTTDALVGDLGLRGFGTSDLLVRALGISLDMPGALGDPMLSISNGSTLLAQNNDWRDNVNPTLIGQEANRLGAFEVNTFSSDSAVLISTPASALNLRVTRAFGSGLGTAMLEVFDRSATAVKAPYVVGVPEVQERFIGQAVDFRAIVGGTLPVTYQWRKNGVPIADSKANQGIYYFNITSLDDAGVYDAVVTNASGSTIAASYTLVVSAPGLPTIAAHPASLLLQPGGGGSLSVVPAGAGPFSYQWLKDGVPIAPGTGATLTLSNAHFGMAGAYSVRVMNAGGSVTSQPATVTVFDAGLINLSVRAGAGTGDQTLIVGFVIAGTGSKQVVLRGVGPGLAQFGVAGFLTDPQLAVFNQPILPIYFNDHWGGGTALTGLFAGVGAFALPADSKDAGLVAALTPGLYSAHVSAADAAPGVAMLEAYDADTGLSTTRFTNLSARSQVGTGENILVAGFAIRGAAAKRLLLRAAGPSLTQFGLTKILARPQLTLYSGDTIVAQNTGWSSSPDAAEISAAADKVGAFAFPVGGVDAALLASLQPGNYTLQVSGADGGAGIALVEVYELP